MLFGSNQIFFGGILLGSQKKWDQVFSWTPASACPSDIARNYYLATFRCLKLKTTIKNNYLEFFLFWGRLVSTVPMSLTQEQYNSESEVQHWQTCKTKPRYFRIAADTLWFFSKHFLRSRFDLDPITLYLCDLKSISVFWLFILH